MVGLIGWVVRHARGVYSALGLYLLVGLGVSTLALGLFLTLAHGVASGVVQRGDEQVLHWLRGHAAPWLDVLALLGTALGSGTAAYLVLAVGGGALWWTRHHLSAVLLALSLLGGRVMIGTLKEFYGRPRPRLFGEEIRALGMRFDYPGGESFPSGHAVTSVIIFGTLAYLVARLERTRHLRRVTLAGALVLVVLIAFSRVYFGVHYPSDVAAGVLAGVVWASFCAFAVELAGRIRWRGGGRLPEEADLDRGMEPVRDALRPDASG